MAATLLPKPTKCTFSENKYQKAETNEDLPTGMETRVDPDTRVDWEKDDPVLLQEHVGGPIFSGIITGLNPLTATTRSPEPALQTQAQSTGKWRVKMRPEHVKEIKLEPSEFEGIRVQSFGIGFGNLVQGVVKDSPADLKHGIDIDWIVICRKDDPFRSRKGKLVTTAEENPVPVLFNTFAPRRQPGRLEFKGRLVVEVAPYIKNLAIFNFAVVPFAYAITKLGGKLGGKLCTGLTPLVLGVAYYGQQRVVETIFGLVRGIPDKEKGMLMVALNQMQAPAAVGGWKLPWAAWKQAHFSSLLEYADPLLDAIMAGSAGALMNSQMEEAFATSMQGHPKFIGDLAAKFGMEGSMTIMLFGSTLLQSLASYKQYSRATRRPRESKTGSHGISVETRDKKGMQALYDLGNVADLASLGSLQHVLQTLDRAEQEEILESSSRYPYEAPLVGEAAKGSFKLFAENLTSISLSISLLGLTMTYGNPDTFTLAVNILSIISSMKALCCNLEAIMKYVKLYMTQFPGLQKFMIPFYVVFVMSILFLASRFVGTLICTPRHSFSFFQLASEGLSRNLTTYGCQ